ncbi:Oidioi.mRNA.OKI2018_I69.chr2.g8092.t1.cds [Oikopleura dioica]|uniref:dolichyl-diphosphooligosaccharide--protein glycotransferase n=1 Tax=Oikopleura dioica TaxID=34765 RepID=A0ABN7TEQ3_OIKDI|nr:Oidioi.mRNA.OKI2018_I69.chr2.g8092.t1.cds [Oikopleura dioica]
MSKADVQSGTVAGMSRLGVSSLLTLVVLLGVSLLGFFSRLFAVIRFESIIHEFDPWFNYRATYQMVTTNFYDFLNWFDELAWYPLGRIVGGTVYPGLMITAGGIHYVLNALGFTTHIQDVCVFTAPIFSGLTAIATYFLTKELWNAGAGLFAAAFIAIAPGYISRSVAGSFDNEGIAIFALQCSFFLWIRAMRTGSMFWGIMTAFCYFYMVSAWGGYVYIINLIPLHVFCLLLMGRYESKLYVSYTTFYCVGQLMAMNIPFVGFQPIKTSEHMASAGVFALLQCYGFLDYLRSKLGEKEFKRAFYLFVTICAGAIFAAVVGLTMLGVVAPWSGRFYSLFDTGYARIHIPIISSVSEHQPTMWTSFITDLHFLPAVAPAGLWYTIRHYDSAKIFLVIYAAFSCYFAGIMVRLMLTLTPVVCMLGGIALNVTFDHFFGEDNEDSQKEKAKKDAKKSEDTEEEEATPLAIKLTVVMALTGLLCQFAVHCTYITSNYYSSPSVVLASSRPDGSRNIIDDYREAYYWLRTNTDDDATIMSWWDYGYQISGMANRTTLVDNNTWNNSHIAMVGRAMASNEDDAYEIMQELGVDYVLVIFGGLLGYSGDDINKFLWMVRIAEGEHPNHIKEANYFSAQGQYTVDKSMSKTMKNCLMYKLSYYKFGDVRTHAQMSGFDRVRNVEIGHKNIKLKHLEEAYTTEHWIVRIYRVKKPSNKSRKLSHKLTQRKKKTKVARKGRKGVLSTTIPAAKGANTRQKASFEL